jgi:predicted nucleic acid-binding protein
MYRAFDSDGEWRQTSGGNRPVRQGQKSRAGWRSCWPRGSRSSGRRGEGAAEAFINEAATARRKIAISTISLAEVVYLIEKNRLPPSAYDELTQALADPEHVFTEAVFSAAIVQAMRQVSRAEVPDMPDRMVAATAVYFDVPVISRDRRIRAASLKTVW